MAGAGGPSSDATSDRPALAALLTKVEPAPAKEEQSAEAMPEKAVASDLAAALQGGDAVAVERAVAALVKLCRMG